MAKDLFQVLKELRQITPDTTYSVRSRSLILVSGDKKSTNPLGRFLDVFVFSRTALAAEIGLVLIIALLGGFLYIKETNQKGFVAQANELNNSINLKLNEIRYLLFSKTTPVPQEDLGVFLDSLKKAEDSLKNADAEIAKGDIETSLEKIKSAEKLLLEIEAALKK